MSTPEAQPAVEVVQHDALDEWRRGIAAAEKQIEEMRPVVAEEREKAKLEAAFEKRDTLYFLCKKRPSKEGEPFRVRAECIAGLPEPDPEKPSMSVWADGYGETVKDAAEEAIHEARFRFAEALLSAKVAPDMEAARDRAARADLQLADLRDA